MKEKILFLTSLKQTCNEYLIKFSENQSAPKLENRKTSPCSPRAPIPDGRMAQFIQPCCERVIQVKDVFIGKWVVIWLFLFFDWASGQWYLQTDQGHKCKYLSNIGFAFGDQRCFFNPKEVEHQQLIRDTKMQLKM